MALIKLGGLAQDVRGSLNGNVFSRNRGGAYVRSKVSPVQPVSAFASLVRAIFRDVSQRWAQTLTDVQRAAWEAFAAVHPFINVFGDSITVSGIAMYQGVNNRLSQLGQTLLDDPPATFTPVDPGAITFTGTVSSAGVLVLKVAGAAAPPDGWMIFATPLRVGNRAVQATDFRLINTQAGGPIADNTDYSSEYRTRFSYGATQLVVGDRLAVKVATVDTATGAITVPVVEEITLVAA